MNNTPTLQIIAIPGIPFIKQGDDLVNIILDAANQAGIELKHNDTLVISSKIVSKAEGRLVDLRQVIPGSEADSIAQETGKDPRIVELVLQQSAAISRKTRGVLVTRHRLGFVSANAGIDQSNIGPDSEDLVLLLPENPDRSATQIREDLQQRTGIITGIVISDSHGRPFRMGNVGVAIGVAGLPAVIDLRGQPDLFGREMQVSTQGYADLIASAAHLICGEGDEGLPVILIRGLNHPSDTGCAADLIRPEELDLYR